MKILSISDGIGTGRHILNRLGIPVERYDSVEIDPWAMAVANKNYPDINQLGNMNNLDLDKLAATGYDCVLGGPPCQDFSKLNSHRKGLEGSKGGLTNRYAQILEAVKPKHFLMENVSGMSSEEQEAVDNLVGVKPNVLDNKHFGPTTRQRKWWTTADLSDMYEHIPKTLNTEADDLAYTLLNTELEDGMTLEDLVTRLKSFDPENGWISITPKLGTPLASLVEYARPSDLGRFARGTQGNYIAKVDLDGDVAYDMSYEHPVRQDNVAVHPTVGIRDKTDFGSIRQNLLLTPGKRYKLGIPNADQYEASMGFPVGYTKLGSQIKQYISDLFRDGKVDPDFVKYAGKPAYNRMHMIGNTWAVNPATYIIQRMLTDNKDASWLIPHQQWRGGRRVDSDRRIKNIVAPLQRKYL